MTHIFYNVMYSQTNLDNNSIFKYKILWYPHFIWINSKISSLNYNYNNYSNNNNNNNNNNNSNNNNKLYKGLILEH